MPHGCDTRSAEDRSSKSKMNARFARLNNLLFANAMTSNSVMNGRELRDYW